MKKTLAIILLPLLSLGSLSAQHTWIVDLDNRPGTNFTDLPPAVLTAAPGDVLRIRGSSRLYSPTVLRHGMSLVGDPVTSVQRSRITSLAIVDLPPAETAVLARLEAGTSVLRPAGRCGIQSPQFP